MGLVPLGRAPAFFTGVRHGALRPSVYCSCLDRLSDLERRGHVGAGLNVDRGRCSRLWRGWGLPQMHLRTLGAFVEGPTFSPLVEQEQPMNTLMRVMTIRMWMFLYSPSVWMLCVALA